MLLPLSVSVIHRVRRFESRFLRALTGWQRPAYSAATFAEFTRKARKAAAASGHLDMTTALLTRVFDTAGRWMRIPHDVPDLALRMFRVTWDTSLRASWTHLQGHGVRRARLGRPISCWDHLLDAWSSGRWRTWATQYAGWSELRAHWLHWAASRSGFANETHLHAQAAVPSTVVKHNVGPRALAPAHSSSLSPFHIFSDSSVVVSIVQGRAAPKQPCLAALCRSANDLIASLPIAFAHSPSYWWLSHIGRAENCLADALARHARQQLADPQLVVFDAHFWHIWSRHGPTGGHQFFLTVDGSTVPEPPSARGTSGATAVLWAAGVTPRPVATLLASHFWASATLSEVAALQMALCLLRASPFSSSPTFAHLLQEVLDLVDFSPWVTEHALARIFAAPIFCSLELLCEQAAFDLRGHVPAEV